MDIQDKHRITLLDAKCEVVCKVQSMLKKMDYGEDIDSCCSEKLFAAIKLINRLDCYCFTNATVGATEVLSVYTMTIPAGNYLEGASVTFYVNGIQVAYTLVTVATSRITVLEALLVQANINYTLSETTFTMTFPCDITNVGGKLIYNNEVVASDATLVTAGVCSVDPCYNCISDSDLPKAYAVLSMLLQWFTQ